MSGKKGFRHTHCRRGHEFTPETTYVQPNGQRTCRVCLGKPAREKKKYCKRGHERTPENLTVGRGCKLCMAERNANHKEDFSKYMRGYTVSRLKTDPAYKFVRALRHRLHEALKGRAKRGSAIKLLGCTSEEAMCYLENQFLLGMSWGNHGEWHVDHIRPLSGFNLQDPEQLAEACHYTNLQPLWAKDNLSKGSKFKEIV